MPSDEGKKFNTPWITLNFTLVIQLWNEKSRIPSGVQSRITESNQIFYQITIKFNYFK